MDIRDEVDRRWEELLAVGAFIPGGFDEDGNEEFIMVSEALRNHDPELWQSLQDELDSDIMSLYAKGLIEMDLTQPNPEITLTDKGTLLAEVLKEIGGS